MIETFELLMKPASDENAYFEICGHAAVMKEKKKSTVDTVLTQQYLQGSPQHDTCVHQRIAF